MLLFIIEKKECDCVCVKRDTNHWSFFWHFLRLRALGVSCVIQTLGCVPSTIRKEKQIIRCYSIKLCFIIITNSTQA